MNHTEAKVMWKWSFIALIALAIVPISQAQELDVGILDVDISEPLSLEQCVRIALQQSPSVKKAELGLEAASLDVKNARASYFPEIGISGQYQLSDTAGFGWEQENYDAQIFASYLLWDHGHRKAELAQAKADEEAVQSERESAKQNLIFDVTEAYYESLEAEKLVDVSEKLLEISRRNVDKATAFHRAGRSIPSDVSAAKIQQANDELELVNAENSFEIAMASLVSIMGLPLDTQMRVQDNLEYGTDSREISLEDSVAKATQERPELDRLQAQMTGLEWSLKTAKWDRWPTVTAECNYDVLLGDYLHDRDAFSDHDNWNVAARVTFPIFDGGVSKRRQQSTEIAIQQMSEDIVEQERSISLEVQRAYLDLERARKSLEISDKQVEDASENLGMTQGRYEQNVVIFLEVLSSQAQYAQALTNQVKAFYDYRIAEKALQKAMGTL